MNKFRSPFPGRENGGADRNENQSMAETPVSLLERLRLRPDSVSWRRLLELYTPLVQSWLRRQVVPRDDVEDLVQDILAVLVRELPTFEHNGRHGAFRTWLRAVTVNRLRGYWRARQGRPASGDFGKVLDQLEDPNSDLSRRWDEEHDRHVARRLTDLIEGDFEPSTWQAFRRLVLGGERAATVAGDLGLSVNAVLLAKSRVLRRLRQEIRGLID
jgi:RNA polymerase sigma-70 factor (ECF subfamily)